MICWRSINSFRWLPVNLHKKHVFVGDEIFIQHLDQRGCDMYGKAIVFYKGVDVLHTMQRGTNKCNILTRDSGRVFNPANNENI